MADAVAVVLSLCAAVVAVLSWRRTSALAPKAPDVQSQTETAPEPDYSTQWQRFETSDRERFERALRGGTESE